MIELLTDQAQSDAAFRRWVDAMLGGSRHEGTGWLLDKGGLFFTNYGQAAAGEIDDQVKLGQGRLMRFDSYLHQNRLRRLASGAKRIR